MGLGGLERGGELSVAMSIFELRKWKNCWECPSPVCSRLTHVAINASRSLRVTFVCILPSLVFSIEGTRSIKGIAYTRRRTSSNTPEWTKLAYYSRMQRWHQTVVGTLRFETLMHSPTNAGNNTRNECCFNSVSPPWRWIIDQFPERRRHTILPTPPPEHTNSSQSTSSHSQSFHGRAQP
ncbi:hypothetical protein F5I97DRAFT_462517 [Phlebopus sp. FC_14]|nr:hypothetical protein F5I97DRAFT_462517 [Phlebopus sp. FC_14]